MSDFLSNFSDDDYKNRMPKKKKEIKQEPAPTEKTEPEKKRRRKRKRIDPEENEQTKLKHNEFDNPDLVEIDEEAPKSRPSVPSIKEEGTEPETDDLHDVEIDPEYQKKQRNKKIAIISGGILVIVLGYTTYYQMTRVKMPNFVDKQITEVRKWATENKMELDLKPAYSLKVESNDVIKQENTAGKKVKKGSTLNFTVSEGPDPEEVIPLPDFKELAQPQAEEFLEKNKAENMSIITEYSDKVDKGKFTRIEFGNKDITAETYRRRDSVNIYYSKGKETFEKNIAVPSFNGKMKTDVEEWAKKNEIAMTYEEVDSDKVEEGKVISQSIPKDKKVAKKDKMSVKISLGKAIIVPYYANYSAETSLSAVEGMEINVQQVFSDGVPYGQLISQSIEAGTKLTAKDSKTIKVVYSYGQPYIKSYFGQLEGDIPKFIYDDFNSKGANITYDTYYVDSDAEKGEIVKMSVYNQYIASNAYITFGISNGRFASLPGKTPDKGPEGDMDSSTAE